MTHTANFTDVSKQAAFMEAMGQLRFDWRDYIFGKLSSQQDKELMKALALAADLITEEVAYELLPALARFQREPSTITLVAVLDGLVDSVYVLYQLSNTLKLPFDAAFREVHNSNMAKRGLDGKVTFRDDGKVLKPDGWTPPRLHALLLRELTLQHSNNLEEDPTP